MSLDAAEHELIRAALAAREHAYAPYSGFKVGAAVRLACGRIFCGVNVENASFGLTVCAERNAVAAAVEGGARPFDIVCVAVAADSDAPVAPCGACRQVLAELAAMTTPILLCNARDGVVSAQTLADLLPFAFVKESFSSS